MISQTLSTTLKDIAYCSGGRVGQVTGRPAGRKLLGGGAAGRVYSDQSGSGAASSPLQGTILHPGLQVSGATYQD